MQGDLPILFKIKRIKEVGFQLEEQLHKNSDAHELKIELKQLMQFNPGQDDLFLTLQVFCHYNDSSEIEKVVDIRVQNIFEIANLSDFLKDNNLYLPQVLIATLVALSISHTRSILAQKTAGSIFGEIYIPIVDPMDVARHFYPHMFEENILQQQKTKRVKKK